MRHSDIYTIFHEIVQNRGGKTPCVLRGDPPAWELGEGLTIPHRKNAVGNDVTQDLLEHRKLCASPDIIRLTKSWRMGWPGHEACMGAIRKPYKILVGKSEVKRPLKSLTRISEDNIRMDLTETGGKAERCGLNTSGSG
jgi:hypothetical protein